MRFLIMCLAFIFGLIAFAFLVTLGVSHYMKKEDKVFFRAEGQTPNVVFSPTDSKNAGGGTGGPAKPAYITVSSHEGNSGGKGGIGHLTCPRKIMQISRGYGSAAIYALADDGTVWKTDFEFKEKWKRINTSLPAVTPLEESYP